MMSDNYKHILYLWIDLEQFKQTKIVHFLFELVLSW